MSRISEQIRAGIRDENPMVRESAARELREYPSAMGVKYLKQLLSDDHAEVRYMAGASIIAIGGLTAVETVAPLLRSQDARLRNTAVEILAKLGTPAIDPVAELLHDRDKDIRKFGVDVLQRIGSTEAEAPLIQALLDDNVNISAAAAEALGVCGTQAAVAHLIQCLEGSSWLKCAALRSLGALGGEDALKAILAVNRHEESMVLFSAVSALGTLADPRSIDFLLELLYDGNLALEPTVMQVIETVFKKTYLKKLDQLSEKIEIHKIIPMLSSCNLETVKSAIGLLGLLRAEESVEALLKLFTESNTHLMGDIEQALLQIKPVRTRSLLNIINDARQPDSVKKTAVRIIGKIGRKDALAALISGLKTAGESLKVDIVKALMELGDPKAVISLEKLLTDFSQNVRLSAIEALARFKAPSSITGIFKLRTDPSRTVRMAAAQSLKHYDVSNLKNSLADCLHDPDPSITGFGLEAIPESSADDFEKEILGLCRHSHGDVRRLAVKKACRLTGAAGADAVIKATSDTDEKVRLAAIRGMASNPLDKTADTLMRIAKTDPAEWNRYEAVQAVGRLNLDPLLPKLLLLLTTGSDLVKTSVLDVLGLWKKREHLKTIERYVSADNDLLRNAALDALEKIDSDIEKEPGRTP